MADQEEGFTPLPDIPAEEGFTPLPDEGAPSDEGFTPLPSFEEEAAAQNDTLRAQFDQALRTEPDKKAGVLRLARDTGIATEVIEHRYDELKASWEAANFDPKKWGEANPELRKLVVDRPELGTVVLRDQELSVVAKAWNTLLSLDDIISEKLFGFTPEAMPTTPGGIPSIRQQYRDAIIKPKKDVPFIQDAKTEKLAKLEEEYGALARVIVPVERFRETWRQLEISKLNYYLMAARAAGQDTYDLEKQIVDARNQAVQRDYNEGSVGQLFSDIATAGASQGQMYRDAGVMASIGGAGGAATGYAITRSPAGARAGALRGASLLGKAGMAYSSFRLESGSAYGELINATTDDGKPVSNEEATGGAVIYGALAAMVELATEAQKLKAMGPIGEALLAGNAKAATQALLKDSKLREIAKRAGKEWLKSAGGEGGEEFVQTLLEDVVAYATRSFSGGQLQSGRVVDLEEAFLAGQKGVVGGLGIGAGSFGINVATQAIARDKALIGGQQVAALAGLKDSPTLRAAPEAVAKMVEEMTAKNGEPVTHLHVDAQAFIRLFQSENADPNEAIEQLMGPGGARQLQEALATGSKLEVPVADYLEKWGGTDVAQKLAGDTSTQVGQPTINEMAEAAAKAKALADTTPTGAEKDFVDVLTERLGGELAATGAENKKDSKKSIALWRAFIHTMAERTGVPAEQLFAEYVLSVEKGDNQASAPEGALAQGDPAASRALTDKFLADDIKKPEGRAARLKSFYIDSTTGLLNERAFKRIEPAGRQVATISVEGVKFANDGGGHEVGNSVYRAAARALAQVAPEAAKVKGDFALYVNDDAELQSIIAKANQSPELKGLTLSGAVGKDIREASEINNKNKAAAEDEGKRAPRGKRPLGISAASAAELGLPATGVENTAINEALQAAFDAITDEREVFEETYLEAATGLLTKDGFDALPRKKFRASIDLNGLKEFNDVLTEEVGDAIIDRFGNALREMGGAEFDAAHISGDEYAAQSDDEAALTQWLKKVSAAADLAVLELEVIPEVQKFLGLPTNEAEIAGLPFGSGVGKTIDDAEKALNDDKERLKSEGKRGPGTAIARVMGRSTSPQGGGARSRSESEARDLGQRRDLAKTGRQRFLGRERLNQDDEASSPRGYTTFARDGIKRVFKVALNKNADLSTFLHESGHVFLEFLGDLSERPDAPDSVKADFATTLKWMGVEKRSDIKREQHEKWARTFEAYLMTGKAPSAALAGVFERFKLWMKNIYRSIASLNADLNEDIRGVFDRLLATDQEIARTQRAMGLMPLFSSPEQAGMSAEQWANYLKAMELATSHATRAAELRAMKDKLREQESWWKEEEKKLQEEAGQEYEEQPARRAQLVLAEMDKPTPEDLDAASDLLGFPTGPQLAAAVAALPAKDAWVKETAAARMLERHPDVFADRQELREQVAKGLHGEFTEQWLRHELEALRKRVGGSAVEAEARKLAAKQIAERRAIGRLDAGAALRAERSSSEKALKAAAKGDFAQAYVFKLEQLLNMHLYKELSQARDERDAFLKLAAKMSADKAQARLGQASPIYRDGVDSLLEALGLKQSDEREQQLATIAEVATQMEADGSTVMFDPAFIGGLVAKARDYRELTVAQMRSVSDALKNIKKTATNKNTVLMDGKRADKETVVASLLEEAATNLPKRIKLSSSKSAETLPERIMGGFANIDGALLKIETMVDWLANGDLESTWFKTIMKPMQDGKAREVDLLNKTVRPILHAFEKMPKAVQKSFMDKLDGAALFPNHRVSSGQDLSPPTRRFELLMMALNSGNESNLQRLLDGRNISAAEHKAAMDLLSPAELAWVQTVWDAAESLWPEASALEERDSGLVPAKISPKPLVTKNGTLKGGYFPAIYDRRVEAAGERQTANTVAALMDPSFTRGTTAQGHLKSRAENFSGAISLEPGAIPSHLAQVVHDIAYREAIKSVGGLILSPKIQATLKDRLGDKRAGQFLQWVKDVGQMRGSEGLAHAEGLVRLSRFLRTNTVTSALGYAVPNMIEDLSNIPAAVFRTDLKTKHMAVGLAEFVASPMKMSALAHEKSGELRTRREQLQRELGRQVKLMTSAGPFSRGPLEVVKHHAFALMEASDWATSTPVWLGAYRQGLANGKTDAQSVTFADATVRKVFPSHSAVDVAGVLRDKSVIGGTMMFYGFLSTYYNGLRDLGHQMSKAEEMSEKTKLGARIIGLVIVVGVFSEFLRGRGPEDDEQWEEWFLRKSLLSPMTSVPFGGDAANLIEAKVMGKQSNPKNNSMIGVLASVGDAMWDAANDKKDPEKRVEAVVRSLGPLTGLPTAQSIRTMRYLYELNEGEVAARNPADFVGGVIYGERKGHPANPASVIGNTISGPPMR